MKLGLFLYLLMLTVTRGFAVEALSTAADGNLAPQVLQILQLEPDVKNGAKVYALCATCHDAKGLGKEDGSFPAIAGQHQAVIIKQLFDFRTRNRDNPTMYPFSDPETIGGMQAIADVTAFIAGMPVNENPGQGSGQQILKAKVMYEEHCALCHLKDGSGNEKLLYPKLQGQHYEYLKRQLIWIRDGIRRNPNQEMLRQLKGFSDKDVEIVADYISRIKVN